MNEQREALIQEFKDKDYRHSYVQEFFADLIATQIRVLREDRNLTQGQLAELADMKQARISLIESGEYSAWSIRTLQRLAEALDVALAVRFEPFSKVIEQIEGVSREHLAVKTFDDELPVMTNTLRAQEGQDDPSLVKSVMVTMSNMLSRDIEVPSYVASFTGSYGYGATRAVTLPVSESGITCTVHLGSSILNYQDATEPKPFRSQEAEAA